MTNVVDPSELAIEEWRKATGSARLLHDYYLIPDSEVRRMGSEKIEGRVSLVWKRRTLSIRWDGSEIARADEYDSSSTIAPMITDGIIDPPELANILWRWIGRRLSPDVSGRLVEVIDSLVSLSDRVSRLPTHGKGGSSGILRFASTAQIQSRLNTLPPIPPKCYYAGLTALWALTDGDEEMHNSLEIASFDDTKAAVEWMVSEYEFGGHQFQLSWQPISCPPAIHLERDSARLTQSSGEESSSRSSIRVPDTNDDQYVSGRLKRDMKSKVRHGVVYDCSVTSLFEVFGKVLSPISLVSASDPQSTLGLRLLKTITSGSGVDRRRLMDLTSRESRVGRLVSTSFVERMAKDTPIMRDDYLSSIEYLSRIVGYIFNRKVGQATERTSAQAPGNEHRER